jgi:hypothetical protein
MHPMHEMSAHVPHLALLRPAEGPGVPSMIGGAPSPVAPGPSGHGVGADLPQWNSDHDGKADDSFSWTDWSEGAHAGGCK